MKYHINALQYHPDKNNTLESTKRFQEIQSAFEYLKSYTNNKDINYNNIDDTPSYESLLKTFIESFTDIKDNISAWILLQKLFAHSRFLFSLLFDNIDNNTMALIYTTLSQYKNIFSY